MSCYTVVTFPKKSDNSNLDVKHLKETGPLFTSDNFPVQWFQNQDYLQGISDSLKILAVAHQRAVTPSWKTLVLGYGDVRGCPGEWVAVATRLSGWVAKMSPCRWTRVIGGFMLCIVHLVSEVSSSTAGRKIPPCTVGINYFTRISELWKSFSICTALYLEKGWILT